MIGSSFTFRQTVRHERASFTLIELLITVAVIAIMASFLLVGLTSAQEAGRAHKTKALVAKLDAIIKSRWDTYRTRRIPLPFHMMIDQFADANGNGKWDQGEALTLDWFGDGQYQNSPPAFMVAKLRLDALRDLMRMELPDRWTDVVDQPMVLVTPPDPSIPPMALSRPSVNQAYLRRYMARTPSGQFEGAECLYMIVMAAMTDEGDSREVFKADDVKDIDRDGAPEFVDGWKRPIMFLRWAPGFLSPAQVQTRGFVQQAGSPAPSLLGGQTMKIALVDSMTSQPTYQNFSMTPGAYTRGTIIALDPTTQQVTRVMGRITGSENVPGSSAMVDCGTSAASQKAPLNGQSLSPGQEIVIMAADPYDYTDVYQVYPFPPPPDSSIPSYKLVPLIFSAGPDSCYGITDDFGTPHHYVMDRCNPYVMGPSNEMIGTQRDLPNEPFFVRRGWVDNIHNHDIRAR